MGGFISGAVAVLIGGGLAFATATGVVSAVSETPSQPQTNVVDYGTNQ